MLIFVLTMGLGIVFFGIRIELVYRERIRVIRRIDELGRIDLEQGRDWRWRWNEYDKITHNEMLFKFWKPVKSFYRNNLALQ